MWAQRRRFDYVGQEKEKVKSARHISSARDYGGASKVEKARSARHISSARDYDGSSKVEKLPTARKNVR